MIARLWNCTDAILLRASSLAPPPPPLSWMNGWYKSWTSAMILSCLVMLSETCQINEIKLNLTSLNKFHVQWLIIVHLLLQRSECSSQTLSTDQRFVEWSISSSLEEDCLHVGVGALQLWLHHLSLRPQCLHILHQLLQSDNDVGFIPLSIYTYKASCSQPFKSINMQKIT